MIIEKASVRARPRQVLVAVMLVLVPFVSQPTAAPSFVITNDLREDYDAARAVFVGEVLKMEKLSTHEEKLEEHRLGVERRYRITFKVEYSWKGAGFQEFGFENVEALTSEFEGFCYRSAISFVEGRKYLVFAYEEEKKNLVVMHNGRSKPLWDASDDVNALRKMDGAFLFRQKHQPH